MSGSFVVQQVGKVLKREVEVTTNVRRGSARRTHHATGKCLIPPIEVKFNDVEDAVLFRKQAAQLSKSGTEGYTGIYYGPVTTLSTRVRCEVNPFSLPLLKNFMGYY